MSRVGEQAETPDRSEEVDHIDALLDEALGETFPASDPIAISFDGRNRGCAAGKRGSKESIAAGNAMDGGGGRCEGPANDDLR